MIAKGMVGAAAKVRARSVFESGARGLNRPGNRGARAADELLGPRQAETADFTLGQLSRDKPLVIVRRMNQQYFVAARKLRLDYLVTGKYAFVRKPLPYHRVLDDGEAVSVRQLYDVAIRIKGAHLYFVSNRYGPAIFIDCHINDFGLGDSHLLARLVDAVGLHDDLDGYRGAPYSHKLRIKAHQIAHEYRRDEDDLVHGLGDYALERMLADFDSGGYVYVTQDHAAKYRAVRVGVFRHQRCPDGRVGAGIYLRIFFASFCHTLMSLKNLSEECQTGEVLLSGPQC
jgi:hypothetical protein